jgi:hypothetical protein
MSQTSGRSCPNCGVPIAAGQRFCTNCGAILEAQPQPPSQYGGPPQAQSYPQAQQVPPYAQQQQPVPPYAQAQQQVPPYTQQPQQQQSPIAEALGALGLLFLLRRYRPGYRAQRQRSGCCGCLVLLLILFILAVPAFLIARSSIRNFPQSLNFIGGSGNSSFTTQPPITTVQINETVPYAGVNITIVNAQQSQTFLDDSDSSTNGMVRLNIKESNNNTSGGSYAYSDVARLILPDKSSVAPANEQQYAGPDPGTTRTNWLDFPVPTTNQVSQLTLQLGGSTEAQVVVPLTGKANLTQYQPKTAQLNVSTQYAGMTWTVTSATVSLSFKGQQAKKGMVYVAVNLKVDNPTSHDFNAYWGDYLRLKSADATSAPTTDTTLPLNFAAGSAGGTGTVIFVLPAGSTSYTLILLNTPSTPYNQATGNFQIR